MGNIPEHDLSICELIKIVNEFDYDDSWYSYEKPIASAPKIDLKSKIAWKRAGDISIEICKKLQDGVK